MLDLWQIIIINLNNKNFTFNLTSFQDLHFSGLSYFVTSPAAPKACIVITDCSLQILCTYLTYTSLDIVIPNMVKILTRFSKLVIFCIKDKSNKY